MSEWITDRRPTKDDANEWCMVLVQNTDGPLLVLHWTSDHAQVVGVPWMPAPEPPSYVEAKRVRRRIENDLDDIEFIQAFPDDPADWDALLDAIDRPKPEEINENTYAQAANWILEVMHARCNIKPRSDK